MGGIEGKGSKAATNKTSNRDGHDPREDEETDSLPVDGLEGAVAETDTDGRASDAHGSGNGQLVLGEDENGDGGSHLHGGATTGRVVGDLVTHNYEDSLLAHLLTFKKEIKSTYPS